MSEYGQSPWEDASAGVDNLGHSMANVFLAQQQGRYRQMQQMQQIALQQAYLDVARQREAREQGHMDVEDAAKATQTNAALNLGKHMSELPQAQRLAAKFALIQAQHPDAKRLAANPGHPEFVDMVQKRLLRDQGTLAGYAPADVARQVPEMMSQGDPRMVQMMATHTPMLQHVSPGGTLYNAATQRPEFTAPGSDSQTAGLDIQRQRLALAIAQAMSNPALIDFDKNLQGVSGAQTGTNALPSGPPPMTATHPKTGQKIVSTDGGATWNPVQ